MFVNVQIYFVNISIWLGVRGQRLGVRELFDNLLIVVDLVILIIIPPPTPVFNTKDTRKVTVGNFSKSKTQNPNFKTNPKSKCQTA